MSIKTQIYNSPGVYVFNQPTADIEFIWADIIGGGSGGAGTQSLGLNGNAGGGGGAGEFVERVAIPFTSSSLTVVVGAAGTAGPNGGRGGAGGQSSVGDRIALGGRTQPGSGYVGGYGGGPRGGTPVAGIPSQSTTGAQESPRTWGGNSGGGGGNRAVGSETQPKWAPGTNLVAESGLTGGGGGGATTIYGDGGDGGDNSGTTTGSNAPATHYGTGGGGAAGNAAVAGGAGMSGRVVIYWFEI